MHYFGQRYAVILKRRSDGQRVKRVMRNTYWSDQELVSWRRGYRSLESTRLSIFYGSRMEVLPDENGREWVYIDGIGGLMRCPLEELSAGPESSDIVAVKAIFADGSSIPLDQPSRPSRQAGGSGTSASTRGQL